MLNLFQMGFKIEAHGWIQISHMHKMKIVYFCNLGYEEHTIFS
jgi:hypothetical protein